MPELQTNDKPAAIQQALNAIDRYQQTCTPRLDAGASDDYVQWLKKNLPALSMRAAARSGETWDAALLLEHVQKGQDHIIDLLAQMKPQKTKEKQRPLCYDDVVRAFPKVAAEADSCTDLIKAVIGGDVTTLKRLIDGDADIHADNEFALRLAVQNGDCDAVKLLLENGANIHANNEYALRLAAQNGHYEVVQLLLDNDADIHADSDMALLLAAQNGHYEVVQLLLDNDADIHADSDAALRWAACNGHYEVVQVLLDNGVDIHAYNGVAIDLAASNNRYDVLELFVYGDDALKKKYLSDNAQYAQYKTWQRLHNGFQAPNALLNKNPYDFKLNAYRAVDSFLSKEGYLVNNRAEYAYNISTLFRTEERVLSYLQKWGKAGRQPLHDCAQDIRIPDAGKINYKAWGDAVLQHGPQMARLVKYADRIAAPGKGADGKGWSLKNTKGQVAAFVYDKASKHPALAALCFDFDWKEDEFNDAVKQIKKYKKLFAASDMKKRQGRIPDIKIDGAVFGKPDYRFYKLPDGDIRGLLLGEFTNCCQHLANQGVDCAKHGFLSEQGGFYVVAHKQTDEIIGQSWAWRGKKDELVFDSLESLSGHFNARNWEQITQESAAQIANNNNAQVSALHIGAGGATPRLNLGYANLAQPVDYSGYRDSHGEQYGVAAFKQAH
jgi:ankyrin repeat protein